MKANTFSVEQAYKNMDRDWQLNRNSTPQIKGDYEIEPTGLDGWMAYRYQYKIDNADLFGYAESIERARANIIKAQEGK